jgi:opacity protein-like surface antigen
VLVTPKLLLFATAGAAWLNQTFTHVGHHEWEQTYIGWTVGGGLEYAVWGNAHLGVEALYMDFGSEQDTHAHDGGTHTTEAKPSGFVARARLTIKIGD